MVRWADQTDDAYSATASGVRGSVRIMHASTAKEAVREGGRC